MIDIIQAPAQDRVIADGNDTVLTVRSNFGPTSYIQFEVFVNDASVPFKTSTAAKDAVGKASLKLTRFYDDYFTNSFDTDLATGFKLLSGLKIKVSIKVTEKIIANDIVVSSITLPTFYSIKSALPMEFTDNVFSLLDTPVREIASPKNGALKFPFFSKENLNVSVYDDTDTAVFATNQAISEPSVMEFTLNISSLSIAPECAWIRVVFKTNSLTAPTTILVPIIRDAIYPVKQVFFQNNCGAYVLRWLVGSFKDERKLSPENYLQQNNTEVTYEIAEEASLSLNSGYHSLSTKNDILLLAKSNDVRLKINGKWLRVAAATKKVGYYEDGVYLYEDRLQFTRTTVEQATSKNAYMTIPIVVSLPRYAFKNEAVVFTAAEIEANYTAETPPTAIRFRSPVVKGQYGYEDANGVYHTIYNSNENIPSAFSYFEIPWADFSKFLYLPNTNAIGTPVDTIDYQLNDGTLWSDISSFNITITSNPGGNNAPVVVMDGKQFILIDNNGDGSATLSATISDPDGDPITIAWSAPSGSGITFNDATIAEPTITLAGATSEDVNTLTVTVTDTISGLVTVQAVDVIAKLSAASISAVHNVAESSVGNKVFDVTVANGVEGGTATLEFNGYFAGAERYAVVDTQSSATPPILTDAFKKIYIDKTFDASGEIKLKALLVDETESDIIELKVLIQSVSAGMVIGTPHEILLT